MKKGQIFEGVIEKIDFPNLGRIPLEDKTVTVKNGVEGQKVRVLLTKASKGRMKGRILEVLERAPMEIESSCPHFGSCGGCTYQTLSYEEQLHLKSRQVRELMKCDDRYEGIKPSPMQFSYRNKMEFSFGDEYKGGPLSLGMHKRGSFHDIVTVSECQIIDEDFRRILKETRDCFADIPFYHKYTGEGVLRHLLVRKAARTQEILVDIVTTSQEMPEGTMERFTETMKGLSLKGNIAGILHTTNDSPADAVINQKTEILYGKDYFYEEILGLRFKISPFSFFQTNSLGAEVLYETVREYIGELSGNSPVVFDLYSGTGTIAQMIAPVAGKVIGVEIVEEAVEAARENAAINGLENCEFIAGDVLKVLDEITEKPDFVILDPPRDGVNPKALAKLVEKAGTERMVYISCKPTSLVRDLEVLRGYGYEVERWGCVDMFPGTVHVETVVLLTRQNT